MLFMTLCMVLAMYAVNPFTPRVPILISCPFFLVVLVIICAAYILICLQTRQNFPEGRNERRAQQNKKLTKTLLIVTFLSFICWLPALIMSFISVIHFGLLYSSFYLNVRRFPKALQYANSVVNCIIYTFRMPMFKSEIKKYMLF